MRVDKEISQEGRVDEETYAEDDSVRWEYSRVNEGKE